MGRLKYGFKVMFCVFVFSLFWIGLSSFSSSSFFFFFFCKDGNGSGKLILFFIFCGINGFLYLYNVVLI